ncbi:Cell death protease [Physocladia obscura]|uniref:Cell death protease n=1 Tax=Physocladia obscura TaxID=109957 RepID=A0AAD5X6Y1_9FUNG|nr:Cell death protease [Physocladia obscura]
MAEQCRNLSDTAASERADDCDLVYACIEFVYTVNGGKACLDVYNINDEIPCDDSDQYYVQENALTNYLNNAAVRKAVHVDPTLSVSDPGSTWVECNNITITQTTDETTPASVSYLPALVQKGVKVVIANGNLDLLLNYIGTEETLGNLT